MTRLRIKNWEKFQHYKHRKPPWIKLYREILDDVDWHELPGEAAKGLIMLWLIASEDNGYLPSSSTLAFRLRVSENRVTALLSDCSKWFDGDDSTVLADCTQDATSETETETEERQRHIASVSPLGSPQFKDFFEKYPVQTGRKAALVEWCKQMLDSSFHKVMASLGEWKASERWQNPQFIPYAAKWLSDQWLSEPVKGVSRDEQKRAGTKQAIERVRAGLG